VLDDASRDGGIAADIRRTLVEHPCRFPSIEAMAVEPSMHPQRAAQQARSRWRTGMPLPSCAWSLPSNIYVTRT